MATHLSHGLIEAVLTRRAALSQTSWYLLWAGVNAVLAAVLFKDVLKESECSVVYHDPSSDSVRKDFFHYAEICLLAGFILSLSTNLYYLLWPRFFMPDLALSAKQKKLLGLSEGADEPASILSTPPARKSPSKPHLITPSPVRTSSAASGSVTPINLSASSWMSSSPAVSPGSPGSTWSSFNQSEPKAASFYISSPSASPMSANSTQSEPAPVRPLRHSLSAEFEKRIKEGKESTMIMRNFYDPTEFISSEAGLLRFFDKTSQWSQQSMVHATRNLNESLREFGGAHDQVPATPPKRYVYQLAPISSSAPGATGRDEGSAVTTMQTVALARKKLGITPEKLDVWTEHLRKWISETIVRPVHKEIEAVNDRLKALNTSENTRIGSLSLNQIAALAVTGYHGVSASSADFSSVHTLIPFLEAHPNQEYLVRRIASLAKKGYLGEYRWNSGESFDGKPWADHLPSDAMIVMHLFATYFDIHLPMTSFDSSRPFTLRHVLKKTGSPGPSPAPSPGAGGAAHAHGAQPSAPTADPVKAYTSVGPVQIPERMRDSPIICLAETSPPHFVFVNKGDVCEPAKGRNNLFHTVLLFLHHVKSQNGGMLGRVNLGLSGINVLWILD